MINGVALPASKSAGLNIRSGSSRPVVSLAHEVFPEDAARTGSLAANSNVTTSIPSAIRTDWWEKILK
jgi:hypothetical protein